MHPNPVLKKLGYSDTDRLVIIHTDDIGMCQASVQAFADLWDFGLISSGAVMMPCPWAPAAAEFCRKNPDADMGVHATLNAEWDAYRWGPLSTRETGSGLVDPEGYLPRTSAEVQQNASAVAVQLEIEIQMKMALEWGIDVTHIDTHMGTVMYPSFAPGYAQTATANRVPAMIPRGDVALFEHMGVDAEAAAVFAGFVEMLEAQGLPMIDNIGFMPLDQPDGQIDLAKKLLGELPPGLTHFILHPSVDTPELRAITPDWPSRVANYKAFTSKELKDFVQSSGLQVIGYRKLRDLMRG
jgi:predicted glycoside hydrolase/deacetylase ChbG (UPF0249 family)